MDVTLLNSGGEIAYDVQADLVRGWDADSLQPRSVRGHRPSGTSTRSFDFVPDPATWYSTKACGSTVAFNVEQIRSDYGAYAYTGRPNIRSVTVGNGGLPEPHVGVPYNLTNIQDGSQLSSFGNLTQPSPTQAFVSMNLTGGSSPTDCARIKLIKPDLSEVTIKEYGDSTAASYPAPYVGPGLYKVRVEEKNSTLCGTAGVSWDFINAAGITLTLQVGYACDTPVPVIVFPDIGTTAGGTQAALTAPRAVSRAGRRCPWASP